MSEIKQAEETKFPKDKSTDFFCITDDLHAFFLCMDGKKRRTIGVTSL